VPQNGGFLTPDGFIFTSFSTNGGPGPDFARGVANATLTDATITSRTLDTSRVFVGGVQVTIPANSFNGFAAAAFAARNITISTPSIDFSGFADSSSPPRNFVIFSSENMSINNSLDLGTFPTDLVLFAGNSLAISSGVTISGNSTELELGGRAALNFNSVNINNTGGDTFVESFGTITLNNGSVSASDSANDAEVNIGNLGTGTATGNVSLNNTLVSGDEVDIFSGGSVKVTGSTPASGQITAPAGIFISGITGATVGVNLSTSPTSGTIVIDNATSGTLTINNGAKLTAQSITLSAASGLFVDSIAPVVANTVEVTAGTSSTATIQNTDLSGVSSLNVSARTIVLSDVALPNSGDTTFTVANHVLAANPNTSQAVVEGDLNFIRNVTFHGVLDNNGAGYTVH
jgi:fibronectin-binding autotransporter adhesin